MGAPQRLSEEFEEVERKVTLYKEGKLSEGEMRKVLEEYRILLWLWKSKLSENRIDFWYHQSKRLEARVNGSMVEKEDLFPPILRAALRDLYNAIAVYFSLENSFLDYELRKFFVGDQVCRIAKGVQSAAQNYRGKYLSPELEELIGKYAAANGNQLNRAGLERLQRLIELHLKSR